MFRNDNIFFIISSVVFLLIDRIIKVIAINLSIDQVNPNLVFGISLSAPFPLLLNFLGVIVFAFVFLLMFSIKKITVESKRTVLILAGVIIGAALGNLVDRCLYAGVIDYISIANLSVFNLADISILVATFWLLLLIWSTNNKKKKNV